MTDSHWQPHLIGELVALRPVAEGDFEALYRVASDPEIWAQHPAHDRWQHPVFTSFFRDALDSHGALVVTDRTTGDVIGSSRYQRVDADPDAIEIGWTFLARSHWGGRFNHEMKRLMIAHAFRAVRRVVFAVGESNRRSRIALERIGATLTTEQRPRTLGNVVINHVVYEIVRRDERTA